jgi:hypothetical protein
MGVGGGAHVGPKGVPFRGYYEGASDDYYRTEGHALNFGDFDAWSHNIKRNGVDAFDSFGAHIQYQDPTVNKQILARDFCLEPPKSFSMMATREGDDMRNALQTALHNAGKTLFDYQQQTGQFLCTVKAEKNVSGQEYDVKGVVASLTPTHYLSRQLQAHMHNHMLYANRCKLTGTDKEYALNPSRLMRHRKHNDLVFQAALAQELENIGIKTEMIQEGDAFTFRIVGISRDDELKQSEATQLIREYAERKGWDPDNLTHKQHEQAWRQTRRNKKELSLDTQVELLHEIGQQVDWDAFDLAQKEHEKPSLDDTLRWMQEQQLISKIGSYVLTSEADIKARRDLNAEIDGEKRKIESYRKIIDKRSGSFKDAKTREGFVDSMNRRISASEAAIKRAEDSIVYLYKNKGLDVRDERQLPDLFVSVALRQAEELQGVWTEMQVCQRAMQQAIKAGVLVQMDDMHKAYERAISHHKDFKLVAIPGQRQDLKEARYVSRVTSDRHLLAERNIIQLCHQHRGKLEPLFNDHDVNQALMTWNTRNQEENGWQLKGEQAEFVRAALSQRDLVLAVQGYAGTGKTTAVRAFRDSLDAHYKDTRKVIGCATAGAAAETLGREAGIDSYTIASLKTRVEAGKADDIKAQLKGGYLVIDEAGMVGSRDLEAMMQLAAECDSRVIMLGDTRQFQSVQAGRPFDEIQQRKLANVVTLKKMTRQKDLLQAEAAYRLQKGEAPQALRLLQDYGQATRDNDMNIVLTPAEERWQGIIDGQPKCKDANDLARVTNAIREQLKANGEITHTRQVGDLEVGIGERLKLTKGYSRYGLREGDTLKVQKLAGSRATLRLENGKTREVDLQAIRKGLAHDYIRTSRRDIFFEVQDRDERMELVQRKASELVDRGVDVVVIASTNADRRELNQAIRSHYRESGRLGEDRTFEGFSTPTGHLENRTFAAGDRIIFGRGNHGLGVKNSDRGTITGINGSTLTVELDKGGSTQVNLDTYKDVDHAYAVTSYKAQGATHEAVVYLAESKSPLTTLNEAYVACTRQKYEAYIITDDLENLGEKVAKQQVKASAMCEWEVGQAKIKGLGDKALEIQAILDRREQTEQAIRRDEGERARGGLADQDRKDINRQFARTREALGEAIRKSSIPLGVKEDMQRSVQRWTEKREAIREAFRKERWKLEEQDLGEAQLTEKRKLAQKYDEKHQKNDKQLRQALVDRFDPKTLKSLEAQREKVVAKANAPKVKEVEMPKKVMQGIESAKQVFYQGRDSHQKGTANKTRKPAHARANEKLKSLMPEGEREGVITAIVHWAERRETIKKQRLDPKAHKLETARNNKQFKAELKEAWEARMRKLAALRDRAQEAARETVAEAERYAKQRVSVDLARDHDGPDAVDRYLESGGDELPRVTLGEALTDGHSGSRVQGRVLEWTDNGIVVHDPVGQREVEIEGDGLHRNDFKPGKGVRAYARDDHQATIEAVEEREMRVHEDVRRQRPDRAR